MLIARVIGTVVAVRKHQRLVGSKIQIVQPLDRARKLRKVIPSWQWMLWGRELGNK